MKGTEKQIKYATDLIDEIKQRVSLFESKGKGERVSQEKMFLSMITENTYAGNVIEVIKNFGTVVRGIELGKTTFQFEVNENGKKHV